MALPEYIPSFQNIGLLPYSTTICNAPKIYPALPEYPPSLRYASLPESNPPSRIYPLLNHYMRHSHNLPLHPRIYPPLNIHMRLLDTPGIQPFLAKNILPFQTPIREPLGIYSSLPKYTPAFFYDVILTEFTPLSCLDKCAFSRRRIGHIGLYIYIIPGDSMCSVY